MKVTLVSAMTTLLGACCAVGILVAGHGYYSLLAAGEAINAQEALDASFEVALRAGSLMPIETSGSSSRAITDHLGQTAAARQAISRLVASAELSQLAALGLWASALALTLLLLLKSNRSSA